MKTLKIITWIFTILIINFIIQCLYQDFIRLGEAKYGITYLAITLSSLITSIITLFGFFIFNTLLTKNNKQQRYDFTLKRLLLLLLSIIIAFILQQIYFLITNPYYFRKIMRRF